jgi:hypothetical protein
MVAEAEFEDVVDEVLEELDFEQDEWEYDGQDDIGFASNGGVNEDDDFFDASIGVLEEIIMGEEFNEGQRNFMQEHCHMFDRSSEMKLEYTGIFQQYTQFLEQHIEAGLTAGVPDFSMERFMLLLE